MSGDTTRPELDEMIAFVRDGDTVLVHSMDRLARNLDDLRRFVPMGELRGYGRAGADAYRSSAGACRVLPVACCGPG